MGIAAQPAVVISVGTLICFCSLPSIASLFLANDAKNLERTGKMDAARKKIRSAMVLNVIGAIMGMVAGVIIGIGLIAISKEAQFRPQEVYPTNPAYPQYPSAPQYPQYPTTPQYPQYPGKS